MMMTTMVMTMTMTYKTDICSWSHSDAIICSLLPNPQPHQVLSPLSLIFCLNLGCLTSVPRLEYEINETVTHTVEGRNELFDCAVLRGIIDVNET